LWALFFAQAWPGKSGFTIHFDPQAPYSGFMFGNGGLAGFNSLVIAPKAILVRN